ncbi:hypothetical protein ACFLZ1_01185 [Patescibacteria group bacterium]
MKEEQYYFDLYDLITIKDCLRSAESAIKVPPQKPKGSKIKAISLTIDLFTYYIKGQRYAERMATVNEWMARDREKEEKVKHALTPENILCNFCSSEMNMTMKHLDHENGRVMFWFECPDCNKRKAIFDNGEEYKSKPNLCPKCSSEVKETFKKKGEVLTTTIICSSCKYKTKEIMDFEKDRKEWEKEKKQDRKLLEKYRSKYCMTDQEGQAYIHHIESMKQLSAMMKEAEEKKKDPAYKKARSVKKLKVNELKNKLSRVLAKEKYVNLLFGKPEIERFVVIPFTLEDSDNKREEYDSRNKCRRIIIAALEKTNWRLMSEGIDYRLGYLTGRLKGYESEEDLAGLFKDKVKQNNPSA